MMYHYQSSIKVLSISLSLFFFLIATPLIAQPGTGVPLELHQYLHINQPTITAGDTVNIDLSFRIGNGTNLGYIQADTIFHRITFDTTKYSFIGVEALENGLINLNSFNTQTTATGVNIYAYANDFTDFASDSLLYRVRLATKYRSLTTISLDSAYYKWNNIVPIPDDTLLYVDNEIAELVLNPSNPDSLDIEGDSLGIVHFAWSTEQEDVQDYRFLLQTYDFRAILDTTIVEDSLQWYYHEFQHMMYSRNFLSPVYRLELTITPNGPNFVPSLDAKSATIYYAGGVLTDIMDEEQHTLTTDFQLHSNYPNPFNPNTTILFEVLEAQNISLAIYNSMGQKVQQLVQNKRYASGYHNIQFDASHLSSGIYFMILSNDSGLKQSRKMTLIK